MIANEFGFFGSISFLNRKIKRAKLACKTYQQRTEQNKKKNAQYYKKKEIELEIEADTDPEEGLITQKTEKVSIDKISPGKLRGILYVIMGDKEMDHLN